jgi:hypothetical protein
MANPIGAGAALMMPLTSRGGALAREYEGCVDEASSVRQRAPEAPLPVIEPEIAELLGRIISAVAVSAEGLTAVELRVALNERPDRLQRALAAGLRGRRIRRSGSRCQTRYLLNA